MIQFLWRWVRRLLLALAIIAIGLLMPVIYNELACIPKTQPDDYTSILPPEHHRPESRTLLTYPEWHIVHAYDDYGQVITEGDPHDFGYLRAVAGYWSSLCALSDVSAKHGGLDGETRQMVYVIGISFTVELLAKAAYEETLGRIAVLIRGDERAALDEVHADHARTYAQFLRQAPWYQWDFESDAEDLATNASGSFRDSERRLALGLEYRVKAAYAELISNAVEQIGSDEMRLRMIVAGVSPENLATLDGAEVIAEREAGTEIETPRYRELTHLLQAMAAQGARFVEIAGNDDVLLTAISQSPEADGAVHSFARQGYGDYRHLILLKVTDLADRLREMQTGPLMLEHVHDY